MIAIYLVLVSTILVALIKVIAGIRINCYMIFFFCIHTSGYTLVV